MNRGCLVLGLVASACGEPTPVEKCDDMVEVLCDRGVQCLPAEGTHAECVQAVQTVLACGSAKQVSASYDRCLSQLEGASCSILFPPNPQTGQRELVLPADCNAVILTRQAPTVTPPARFGGAQWLAR